MPRPCASCAPLVFRCFKKVERFADWLTGAAGPVFVALAWVLMGSGALIFFELVYPSIRPHLPSLVYYPLTVPLLGVAVNLFGHYWLVCNVSPGSPSDGEGKGRRRAGEWWWAQPRRAAQAGSGAARRWDVQLDQEEGLAEGGSQGGDQGSQHVAGRAKVKKCRKCGGAKPERAHHCSVCKVCVLKFDHHCPWINGCVGLRNERHFILFMAYLVLACTLFCSLSWQHFLPSLNLTADWPYHTPRIAFTLTFVLALALGIAVAVMCSWHLLQVCWGETSVEGHDNAFYSNRAKNEGRPWENRWDLGWRRNLEVFFNIGPDGYPYTTLLLPYRIMAHSDGVAWERRAGYIETGEEDDLTDDDEGGGGYL